MHHTRTLSVVALAGWLLSIPLPAQAAVSTVPPFAGQFSDTFDQYTTNNAVLTLPVFGGAGEIHMLDAGGSIKVEFSSQLGGDLVVPISGMMIGQLGVAEWVFATPARRFGGWWENNSGADHATVEFFDPAGGLIDTHVANVPASAQQWTWNGWLSDAPVARIRVTGNGLVSGFIWYENMQLEMIPEPALVAIGLAPLLALRRTRGHSA